MTPKQKKSYVLLADIVLTIVALLSSIFFGPVLIGAVAIFIVYQIYKGDELYAPKIIRRLSPLDYVDMQKLVADGKLKESLILALKRGFHLSDKDISNLTPDEVNDYLIRLTNVIECRACGGRIADNARYCPHCGANQEFIINRRSADSIPSSVIQPGQQAS